MLVKLRDDAPWNSVTLNESFEIFKSKFVELGTNNIEPIAKWVEEKEFDYSLLSKQQLVALAKEKNLSYTGLDKAGLVELLKDQA